jgi:hypothetical protein
MNSFFKRLVFFVSYEFFFYLAASMALWYAAIGFLFKLGPWDAMGLLPSKIMFGLLFLNRLFGFFVEAFNKRKSALITAGIIMALCGVFIDYLYRFEGVAELGEGESFTSYKRQEAGPLGKTHHVSLALGGVDGRSFKSGRNAKAEVYISENEFFPVVVGRSKRLSPGLSIKLSGVDLAPKFIIKDKEGMEVFSAFIKMRLYKKDSNNYFMISSLPHRFYINLTGKEDKPFGIRALRSKIIVAKSEMAQGEQMEVEGFKVSIPEFAMWSEIQVKYSPGDWIIVLGLLICAIGAVVVSMFKGGKK